MTRWNVSHLAVREYIEEKLGLPRGTVNCWSEEILLPYDDDALLCVPRDEAERQAAINVLFDEAVKGYVGCVNVYNKIDDWFHSISNHRPIQSVGQKCGMDRPSHIAVNLMGEVTTCQNTAAQGNHKIGHVDDWENIALNTSHHHQNREECRNCPVVQMCKGACMFLEGEYWQAACDMSFTYNRAMLAIALWYLTGWTLIEIVADEDTFIRRPGVTRETVIELQEKADAA